MAVTLVVGGRMKALMYVAAVRQRAEQLPPLDLSFSHSQAPVRLLREGVGEASLGMGNENGKGRQDLGPAAAVGRAQRPSWRPRGHRRP